MTIRELAHRLNLSKTTVADAIRGNPVVREETRLLVQAKAREWGYAPNPVASAFLQQIRSKGKSVRANLAFLDAWKDTSPLLVGAMNRAHNLGYNLDFVGQKEYDSPTLTRILKARGVLGLAISPLVRPVGHLTLEWSKFTSVAFGYSMARPGMNRVVHNHFQGIRTLYRRCLRKGYRRIGLALQSDKSDLRSNGLWSAGYQAIQQQVPAADRVKPFLVPESAYNENAISRWIKKEKPEVVFFHTCAFIPKLSGIFKADGGSVVPVVLDRIPGDPCAGIDQQHGRCGALMIDLLALQILHNETGLPSHPSITMVEGDFVDHPTFGNKADI
ncbi:MAG: LacI family DNA-binding transcriptional regulator [Candidatus Methylacidiphilales bacterium]|nr:LacI family DNA-binding transcriptional regulator [Candidatus Methylacidiphilales bacterium]